MPTKRKNDNYMLRGKVNFSTSSQKLVDSNNLKPAVVYQNADIDKGEIIQVNKNKSGVYR